MFCKVYPRGVAETLVENALKMALARCPVVYTGHLKFTGCRLGLHSAQNCLVATFPREDSHD
jgi:hypothetical protein